MAYAQRFLLSRGTDCIIDRIPSVQSKISLKRSTRSSRDLGSREAYWEGLILASSLLQSGEVLTIENSTAADKYLVQTVNTDAMSGELAFFVAKCNAQLMLQRESITGYDSRNNPVKKWDAVQSDIAAYGEIVTYQLRQYDPGLLEQTRYVFQVPKAIGFALLDRIIYNNGENLQVVSIDDIALKGVVRLQLAADLRS